ncbi:MAG TPA: chromophore lyase CpcT/CpeT [Saprospiraceae bacterium]|nr:chromophore lyase CpcT/CpeT [Saprospiraceae bacterium]
MKHQVLFFGLLLSGLLAANWHCTGAKKGSAAVKDDLELLAGYMIGDFSSQAQSQRDSAFFDIRLHIRPIWTSEKGSHWLYVEQATATAESKPYRQRVYKLEKDGQGGFKSIVYTLPDQANWAGKYKTPEAFSQLKPADLSLRDGCTVFLKKQKNGTFTGATQGTGCESTLRGAKYASSTVTITPTMLLSWDQGFNEKGEQVWGATKGGYEFIKM